MKKIFATLLAICSLLIGFSSFAGIDYIDYHDQELKQQHQNSENLNRSRERDQDWKKDSKRDENYQHQNRSVREKTIQTRDSINNYPEKFIP